MSATEAELNARSDAYQRLNLALGVKVQPSPKSAQTRISIVPVDLGGGGNVCKTLRAQREQKRLADRQSVHALIMAPLISRVKSFSHHK